MTEVAEKLYKLSQADYYSCCCLLKIERDDVKKLEQSIETLQTKITYDLDKQLSILNQMKCYWTVIHPDQEFVPPKGV